GRGPACPAPSLTTTNTLPPNRQPCPDSFMILPAPPPPCVPMSAPLAEPETPAPASATPKHCAAEHSAVLRYSLRRRIDYGECARSSSHREPWLWAITQGRFAHPCPAALSAEVTGELERA